MQLAARATGMDSQKNAQLEKAAPLYSLAQAPRVLRNARHPARRAGGVARGDAGALLTAGSADTLCLHSPSLDGITEQPWVAVFCWSSSRHDTIHPCSGVD